ncbi:PREDICTED: coiled-coil-helix-coiled-coil-helix domain-containing protein 7 [Dinoponera quadriceps]|uniref:Coiled-coil-helix-coiled-coil-helix domain-containing protein 7 n=1 Tax=Dinoponera quadriceps TaxID=609295 RepID=A0A6P3WMC3_DINQU|nr:PREDICTED: coiled-coil-helix-coiled-coil-helix domain-containing protein 7 [Dinoponera quadriceps]
MGTENKLNNEVRKPTHTTNKFTALKRDQNTDNPCYQEQLLSLKCLDLHQDNRNECKIYFTNYNNCSKFWATVWRDRKLKDIKPYLPPVEERAKIKADYLNFR